MTKNEIYLQKRLKVLVPPTPKRVVGRQIKTEDNQLLVLTMMKNLDTLGYTFSRDLFNQLRPCSKEQLVGFYNETVKVLKKMKGAHVKHKPFYPNFPIQVMEMSDLQLYLNAVIHYWTLLRPVYTEEEREPLLENNKVDVIELGSDKDFNSIFTTLLSAKSSISEFDKSIVEWFVINTTIDKLIPAEVPLKENVGLLVGKCMEHKIAVDLSSIVKTSTDVLRVCTAISGGDVSLAKNCKFKKLSRYQRKYILGLLEKAPNLQEDMLKHKNRWIKLGEILHPGDYQQFTKTNAAFKALRNNLHIETFNSNVEAAISHGQIIKATRLLADRPGMLARRMDQLVRNTKVPGTVVNEFLSVADKVATPVLLQVSQHFQNRDKDQELRTIFPKGSLAKVQVLPNDLPLLPTRICHDMVVGIDKVLVDRFKDKPKLGKVYVDENLANYLVPFSQRSASKALKTIVRGSKLPLDGDYDTLRFFIWWKNQHESKVTKNDPWAYRAGRVDIDLSAMLVNEDLDQCEQIAYYNLRGYGGHHSGDIVDAPNGASEFIDISLNKCQEAGYRYVIMCINSYSGQPYHELPECFAGWMGRERPNSGEIFEPKTVKNKIDVTGDTRINLPFIVDTVERKIIWTDLALKQIPHFSNNIHNNKNNIALLCKAMTQLNKYNLYDLFSLHATARGKLVDSPEKADVVFSETEGVTPFDVDKIMSEYL